MSIFLKITKWIAITLFASVAILVALVYGTEKWQEFGVRGCPILVWLTPIRHTPIQPNDYLQLANGYAGPGGHGGDTIRVYGDGRIDRDTTITFADGFVMGCPLHEADKHLRIPSAQASAIIAKARDGGFCRLCAIYSGRAYDAGSHDLTLNIQGKSHQVISNYVGYTPPIFREVEAAILQLSPPVSYANRHPESPERKAECKRFEDTQFAVDKIRHPDRYPLGTK